MANLKSNIKVPKNIVFEFVLKLNVKEWSKYKFGQTDKFLYSLFDEECGLVRFPIHERWDIVSCEFLRT